MRSIVVLPQPLGPSSATMLPGSMLNDTSSTATRRAVALGDVLQADLGGIHRPPYAAKIWLYLSSQPRASG